MYKKFEHIVRQALIKYEAGIQELKGIISPANYYMDIKALSIYSGISVRKLKDLIRHPEYPLPAYKVDGSIRIKKSEFETWINKFRIAPEKRTNIDEIVNDVIRDIKKSA